MLYLAIPAQNEVATIGVLLWRLRTVLAEFPREYEVVVYDDASADETADVAEQYAHAMPVTVLRGAKPVGYAGAIDALVRYVSGQTRYPRRDAMLLLQGDFTDPPGIVPEFARRFEGGADLVIGERTAVVDAPKPVKRLFAAAGWALRPFVKVDGVKDLTSSMRLVRISVLRDALRVAGDAPLCAGDSWTANADLLLRLVPHARRVESVPMEPTYGVRMRDTRRVTVRDALATLRWGWGARGRRAVPTTAPESTHDANARPPRGSNNGTGKRRDEPEMTAERLRERKRDRDRPRTDSSLEDAAELARREKGRRDRRDARTETLNREALDPAAPRDAVDPPLPTRPPRQERVAREERAPREERTPREERPPREERVRGDEPHREKQGQKGPGKSRQRSPDFDEPLEDPFAAPASSARRNARANKDRDFVAPSADDSPYADEVERPLPNPFSTDAPRPDAVVGRRNDAVVSGAEAGVAGDREPQNVGNESTETGAADTDGEEADGAAVDSAEAGGGDAATRERKRRRNRRSRRRKGRAKSGDGAGEASGETVADGDSSRSDSADRAAPRNAANRNARPVTSESEAAADTDVESDSPADSDPSDAGLSEEAAAQARAKRRGRRGRRGGARRSRNRGKTDGAGEGAADGPAGDGTDAGA